jgi:protein gp37
MSDLFHAKIPESFIRQVFDVMAATPRHTYQILTKRARRLHRLAPTLDWPSNVWVGVSVENMKVVDRIDDLRMVPANIRFLSCEPLLGPLDDLNFEGIGWVIAGGESGRGARPVQTDWITALRDQCVQSNVPFFFKQWGGATPKAGGRVLDGRLWDQMPDGQIGGNVSKVPVG